MEPVHSKARMVWSFHPCTNKVQVPTLFIYFPRGQQKIVCMSRFNSGYFRMNNIAFQQCARHVFIAMICFDLFWLLLDGSCGSCPSGVPSIKVSGFSY